MVPLAGDKFDSSGDIIDEAARVVVRDLLIALAEWTHRLAQGERLAS